jgi:DNA-binding transcriptional ArsR family regulator
VGVTASALVDRGAPLDVGESFFALSDRTRRDVIRTLMHRPRSAGELARCLLVSPQALSRHLRVLRKAGLVAEEVQEQDARIRIYSARPIALEPVQEWLWRIEDLWRQQLASFKSFAESNHRGRRPRHDRSRHDR